MRNTVKNKMRCIEPPPKQTKPNQTKAHKERMEIIYLGFSHLQIIF